MWLIVFQVGTRCDHQGMSCSCSYVLFLFRTVLFSLASPFVFGLLLLLLLDKVLKTAYMFVSNVYNDC